MDDALTVNSWRRLAPIAIVYFTASGFLKAANTLFYLLPVMAINYQKIIEQPSIVLIVGLAVFTLLLSSAVLNYIFYEFRIDADRVEIKSGVLKKSHVDLPFAKIQNVRIEQPLYYRFNNYVCLQLDTAGSAQQEAKIVALPMAVAKDFRQHIVGFMHENKTVDVDDSLGARDLTNADVNADEAADEHDASQTTLNTRSLSDLVIHGVANNRIWILLGGLAPFYNVISENVAQVLERFGIDLVDYFSLSSQQWWQFALHVMSLVMLIMLLMVSLSVIGSILTFYNYRLTRADNRLIRTSGLLTKQEVSIKLSRLQIIVFKQDWLDRLMGRINLTFEQNSSMARGNNQAQAHTDGKLIVPSVTPAQALDLSRNAWPDNKMKDMVYTPISQRFIMRYIMLLAIPLSVSGALGLWLDKVPNAVASMGFVLAVGVSLAAVLRWYRWGFAQDDEYVYIRKGFFGIDYYCLPKFKIQQTALKQSFLMRLHNLASAKLVLASGSQIIPFVQQTDALGLLDQCLIKVEKEPKSWM